MPSLGLLTGPCWQEKTPGALPDKECPVRAPAAARVRGWGGSVWPKREAGAGVVSGGGLMVPVRGGFFRCIRRVLECESGNEPACVGIAVFVLVLFCVGVMAFRQAYPDRGAALEAWLEARLNGHGPVLDLVYRVLAVGVSLACALVVGMFVCALASCRLEGRRARRKPPAAGPGGGAAGRAEPGSGS